MKRGSILGICFMLFSCGGASHTQPLGEYDVMEVKTSDQALSNSYSATIVGRQVVDVRAQVSGFITQISASEGASVRRGQTLFVIDQVPYKAALQVAAANVESAKANVATAELTVQSKVKLLQANVVSDYDLQTAKNTLNAQKAALAQAEAQLINARNNLSYTVVTSPTDGVIGMIAYRVGALVSASSGEPLVTVSDNEQMYIYFSMTENQMLAISRQNGSTADIMQAMPKVELRLSDGTLFNQKGKIDAISGIVNSSTGAVTLRATFPNPDKILRSGGSGNLIFPYRKPNSIVIPQSATYEIQDRLYVYKVENGIAKSTAITVFDVNDGHSYIVEQGLVVGDSIVASGAGLVCEGTVINSKK